MLTKCHTLCVGIYMGVSYLKRRYLEASLVISAAQFIGTVWIKTASQIGFGA